MKKLGYLLTAALIFFVSCLTWGGSQQAHATNLSFSQMPIVAPILAVEQRRNRADQKKLEIGNKIDLNNSSIREFREFKGMYPTLAQMIIKNAPFDSVEEVLEMPDLYKNPKLTDRMKATLTKYLDEFTVTPPTSVLQEGDFRLNTGTYD